MLRIARASHPGYPPRRSPPAIEGRAAAPWITLRIGYTTINRNNIPFRFPTQQLSSQITLEFGWTIYIAVGSGP
jgi:hypothetical protein